MPSIKRPFIVLALVLAVAVVASAQCPGGNCGGAAFNSPQVQYYMQPQAPSYYQQSYSANMQYQSSGPSWSYPGSVANHLMRDHGVNPVGMSHAQMVQLHNNLHNSERSFSRTVTRNGVRPRFFRRIFR